MGRAGCVNVGGGGDFIALAILMTMIKYSSRSFHQFYDITSIYITTQKIIVSIINKI